MGSSLVLHLGALGRLFEKSLSQLGSGGPSDHPSFGGVICFPLWQFSPLKFSPIQPVDIRPNVNRVLIH